jgi:hypothetical protein
MPNERYGNTVNGAAALKRAPIVPEFQLSNWRAVFVTDRQADPMILVRPLVVEHGPIGNQPARSAFIFILIDREIESSDVRTARIGRGDLPTARKGRIADCAQRVHAYEQGNV